MKLLGRTTIGRRAVDPQTAPPENDSAAPPTTKLEAQRIRSARVNAAWTELDPSMLVRRGRRFLVHADTDQVYTPYTGAVWNKLGGIDFAHMHPLYYVVDGGQIRLLEKYSRTWSDIVRTQAGAR